MIPRSLRLRGRGERGEAPLVALDLGSSRALALAARAEGEGVEVLGFAEAPCKGVRRGIVNDLEATARAADAALRELGASLGIETGAVTLSVGGAHVEGTTGQGATTVAPRGRTITHGDVAEVVDRSKAAMFPPDRELFQALPREFRIDGEGNIHRPLGMSGGRLEVVTYLVSGQSAHLQNLERAVAMHGRRVEGMVLSPLAAGIAVLGQEEIESGAAVVDVGAGKTDLAVFAGGSLVYSATVPVGAGMVTSDVSKLLKTSPEEGERLKIECGSAWSKGVGEGETVEVRQIGVPEPRPMQRRVLAEIIESRMAELATMIGQHLERSGYAALLPGGVALTGGGSRLAGTEELFGETLRGVLRGVRVRSAWPRLPSGERRPEFAAAVGLAQFGLQNHEEAGPGGRGALGRVRSLFALRRPGGA